MKPPQGLDAAFEDDPHGVRELLRGLPAPGPMPADVSGRIRDALAQERTPADGELHGVDIDHYGAPSDDERVRELLRELPDPGPMPAGITDSILAAFAAQRSGHRSTDDSTDENADPSRIRDLLRELPDPGPMPAAVSKRIEFALADERATAHDADPTGMRDLLRELPDPGPMPSSVADRVEAALAHETGRRDERPDNVTPLRSRTGGSRAASTPPATRRTGMLRLVGGAAAAAVAGVIAFGAFQSMDNDAPPTQAVPTKSVDATNVADKVHVTSSDKNYTAASFRTDAAALAKADVGPGLAPADANKLGSVATKDGALSCASAIGKGVLDESSRITIDIARYESKPALVVVVTKDGKSTGWVLNRNCDSNQAPVAGPTQV